jgi:hypothetical protein
LKFTLQVISTWLIEGKAGMQLTKHKPLIAVVTALTFLHVTLWTTAAALSQEERRLAVFVLAKNKKLTAAAIIPATLIREEVGKLKGVALRTGSRVGNPKAAVEATRLTNEGFKLINTEQHKQALPLFKRARDLLAQNSGAGDMRLHARVAKGLGVTYVLSKNSKVGHRLIKRSLLLYPRQSELEYAYSVDVRDAFSRSETEIREMAKGRIEVRSNPQQADVFLDGVFKGYTPVTLHNVPAGSHIVTVVKDGYLRWAADVEVTEAGRTPIQAVMTASPVQKALFASLRRMVRRATSKTFARDVKPLLSQVNANEALVLVVTGMADGFKLAGSYSDRAGKVTPIRLNLGQDAVKTVQDTLTATLKTTLKSDRNVVALDKPPLERIKSVMKKTGAVDGGMVIDPDSPLFKIQEKEETDSIINKWWFWTIVGAAVVGTAVTVILVTTGGDDGPVGAVGNLSITLKRFNK